MPRAVSAVNAPRLERSTGRTRAACAHTHICSIHIHIYIYAAYTYHISISHIYTYMQHAHICAHTPLHAPSLTRSTSFPGSGIPSPRGVISISLATSGMC